MMSIVYIFWMYVILFAIVGGMRGWAKELLVAFSVILALALNHVIRRYIPIAAALPETDVSLFWVRTIVLLVLVFFGYQTVITISRLAARAARERLQDTLFGVILGAFNGYLIAGTILYYMHVADYPFQNVITKPQDPALLQTVNQMMLYMPPQLLGEPGIYFAVILAFIFVIVVYI
jgi:colicin V production protein